RTAHIGKICLPKQVFKVVKVIIFLLTVAFVNVYGNIHAQHITLNKDKISLKTFFKEVRKQTGFHVLLESGNVAINRTYEVHFQNTDLSTALKEILEPTGLTFVVKDRTIVVTERVGPQRLTAVQSRIASGHLVDTLGNPLSGVTVSVKNTANRTTSNAQGYFEIIIPSVNAPALVFSFIGMQTREIPISQISQTMRVVMHASRETLADVVVTGYTDIRKESFTGNAITV